MAHIQLHVSDWEAGFVAHGFPIPPIGKFLGGRLESHDPNLGVLRVSFPTKPDYANPGGAVMGGIVAAFLDDVMGPLVVAATGGEKFPVTLDLHTTYFKPVPIGRAPWSRRASIAWAVRLYSRLRISPATAAKC